MENKYFSVGERVGLVSKDCPELNGEYTISYHKYDPPPYGHHYVVKNIPAFEGDEGVWCLQDALRKIHKSGGTSFDYMMNKLSAQEKAMNLIKNNVGEIK